MSGSGLSNADLEVMTFWLFFDAENELKKNHTHKDTHALWIRLDLYQLNVGSLKAVISPKKKSLELKDPTL